MNSRSRIVLGAALALIVAFPPIGRADDKDKDKKTANTWVVHFGQPQPQTPDPAPVAAAVTHFLVPNDLTINKGDTVIFTVNGGGHGIAIHPVAKKTTREDIAEDLCDGATAENPDPILDRRGRAAVCNGTAVRTASVNGTSTAITGTQNLDYSITDGKDHLIIHTGFNLTAANSVPATVIDNPRVDDKVHTTQLLATSGQSKLCGPGETPPSCDASAANGKAGAFLGGSAGTQPGNQIPVVFRKSGRYLVICMNRGHSLNDHMFGFISVVDDDDDDDKDK
jgi:hypothetical protein